MLHKALKICSVAITWALAWGFTGAILGAVIAIFQPDTGHIPSSKMPIFIGVPSAVFGLGAGLVYGILTASLSTKVTLRMKDRAALGALVGCGIGVAFMRILAHSYLTVLVAGLLALLLATNFFRKAPTQLAKT